MIKEAKLDKIIFQKFFSAINFNSYIVKIIIPT